MFRLSLAAALAALSLAPPALAQEPPPPAPAGGPSEEPTRTDVLDEIVVKSRRDTRVDTLEVREVRETPAHDLGEALAQAGLASAVRRGGIASDVVVRGFQRDAVAVTIDGARLHGACPNRMDPPSFHVDYAEVDRVEVRKGPYDVASPGGMGGTLDVRTRSPGRGPFGEVNAGYGQFGALETSLTAGYGADRAGVLGGAAFKQASPFESGAGVRFTEIYPAASPNRYRPGALGADAYDVRTGWLKATAIPAAGHRLELSLARQEADDVLYPYLRMDARYDDTNRVNASWELPGAGPVARARAQAWFNHVAHDMDDARRCSSSGDPAATCAAPLTGGRGWSMRTDAASWVAGGLLEATRLGPAGGETTAGVDFYARSWDATTTRYRRPTAQYFDEASVPDVTMLDLGLRAQHAQPLGGRVKVTAGVRLDLARAEPGVDRRAEYATYHAAVPADLRREDVFVSGNVQADVGLTGALSLFAGYGRGVRLPDPQERYFALSSQLMGTTLTPGTVGNPALGPVTNDQVDLGVKLAAGRLLLKAQVYRAWISDHVAVVQVASLANPALRSKSYAAVSASSFGGEASARVALPADLYVTGSVAYVEARNETADTWLQETPPLRGAVALRYDVRRWFAELETVLSDDHTRVDAAAGETPTAGWVVANVKAGLELRGARVFAGVRNVFDRAYYEATSYLRDPFAAGVRVPEPGRVVYVNGQYTF